MADYERRNGFRGGYNNRKKRFRGMYLTNLSPPSYLYISLSSFIEDDDLDRRQRQRRTEEPLQVKIRKQLLGIAESVWLTMVPVLIMLI